MTHEKGKVTVGVTDEGARHLEALMQTPWFETEMAAYLLAISTSLSKALVVSPTPLTGVTTKFNIGSLDRDGHLRDLIRLLGPQDVEDPYEYAERLADVGLEFLRRRVVDRGRRLSDVLQPTLATETADASTEVPSQQAS